MFVARDMSWGSADRLSRMSLRHGGLGPHFGRAAEGGLSRGWMLVARAVGIIVCTRDETSQFKVGTADHAASNISPVPTPKPSWITLHRCSGKPILQSSRMSYSSGSK